MLPSLKNTMISLLRSTSSLLRLGAPKRRFWQHRTSSFDPRFPGLWTQHPPLNHDEPHAQQRRGFNTTPSRTITQPGAHTAHATIQRNAHNESQENQLSTKQKAQRFLRKYGAVFVGTYISIYISTLFSVFAALDSGLLDPDIISQIFKVSKDFACETADVLGPTGCGASMDEAATAYAKELSCEMTREKRSVVEVVTGYLSNYEWSRGYAEKMEKNPHLANFAVAWFCTKFTEPIRLALAFVVVPKVAKALGREKEGKESVKN